MQQVRRTVGGVCGTCGWGLEVEFVWDRISGGWSDRWDQYIST